VICIYCRTAVDVLIIDPDLVPAVAMCRSCYGRVPEHLCVRCDREECECSPAATLCWSCGELIRDGDGRAKGQWFVHALCPGAIG